MILEARNISFAFQKKPILQELSLVLEPGKLTVITGPNGSGKSTLIHLLGGAFTPQRGEILLEGRNLETFSHVERACRLGVLTQEKLPALDFSVSERIMLGRFALLPRLSSPGERDKAAVEESMKLLQVEHFAGTPCNQLSGGEYQKVLIAALLARETPVMLLDEPTSALDPAGARHTLEILTRKKASAAVAVVTHDLSLAAAFADELILVKEGRFYASGAPEKVLTQENIKAVYGCGSEILRTPSGTTAVVFK